MRISMMKNENILNMMMGINTVEKDRDDDNYQDTVSMSLMLNSSDNLEHVDESVVDATYCHLPVSCESIHKGTGQTSIDEMLSRGKACACLMQPRADTMRRMILLLVRRAQLIGR